MTDQPESKKQFSIQKLYVKDASFESPASPAAFSFQQWDPHIDLNLKNSHSHVDGDIYEAVLRVTVTATHQEKTTFLIEIQQAGLFSIAGFNDEEHQYLLGSQCMNILFPYAREQISDISVRGGFPPLLLSPVNFDALYQQHLQQQEQEQGVEEETVKH